MNFCVNILIDGESHFFLRFSENVYDESIILTKDVERAKTYVRKSNTNFLIDIINVFYSNWKEQKDLCVPNIFRITCENEFLHVLPEKYKELMDLKVFDIKVESTKNIIRREKLRKLEHKI